MATPVAGDGVLALMPQEVVNSIDPSPFNGSSEKSPILIFVCFQKAIRTELNRLHHDAVELATAGSGDVRFLAERCIFLFDIYQHHCNAEDVLPVLSILKLSWFGGLVSGPISSRLKGLGVKGFDLWEKPLNWVKTVGRDKEKGNEELFSLLDKLKRSIPSKRLKEADPLEAIKEADPLEAIIISFFFHFFRFSVSFAFSTIKP
ncbi:CHY zinc finger [Musa troglodytarum]|uniref:CHY zinc finger n=1 Tax=Musa troglodytarum TaxID=320322 RepID=A0A9E7EKX0_9LILI|nr:CHY zinc finger [Musa troglodytarum]